MIADKISALSQLTIHEKWVLAAELGDEVERYLFECPADPEALRILDERERLNVAETQHLLSTQANAERLTAGLHDFEAGRMQERPLSD